MPGGAEARLQPGIHQLIENSGKEEEQFAKGSAAYLFLCKIHFREAGLPKVILAGEDVQRHVGEDIIRICVLKID